MRLAARLCPDPLGKLTDRLAGFKLNSTNHPKEKEWFNKRKEAKKLIYISPIL